MKTTKNNLFWKKHKKLIATLLMDCISVFAVILLFTALCGIINTASISVATIIISLFCLAWLVLAVYVNKKYINK